MTRKILFSILIVLFLSACVHTDCSTKKQLFIENAYNDLSIAADFYEGADAAVMGLYSLQVISDEQFLILREAQRKFWNAYFVAQAALEGMLAEAVTEDEYIEVLKSLNDVWKDLAAALDMYDVNYEDFIVKDGA